MGAGVLPFCLRDGRVLFLLTKSFSGRKAGYLNDFGGGVDAGEDYCQAAVREFVEETETMFFADNLRTARRTPERIRKQIDVVSKLFDATLGKHPDWWCRRDPGNKVPPRDWRTYFIEMNYRDVEPLNVQWRLDGGRRFTRRRELSWIPAHELLDIYQHHPQRLWKRVRQLEGAPQVITSILRASGP